MAAADRRMTSLLSMRIDREAAEERQRQAMLTMQRRQRVAGRVLTYRFVGLVKLLQRLVIRFRRRKDQFRIAPFQGIAGISGIAAGAANKMVNI